MKPKAFIGTSTTDSSVRCEIGARRSAPTRRHTLEAGYWVLAFWAWSAAGLLLGIFYKAISASFIPVDILLWHAWMAAGCVLLLCYLYLACSRTHGLRGACLAISTIATMTALTLGWQGLVRVGDEFRFRIKFQWLLARYKSIVGDLERNPVLRSGWHEDGAVRYYVEVGPPMRIAFEQSGGILDNWEGIVYDPSGDVLRVRELTRGGLSEKDYDALQRIRRLFGGELCWCAHIIGHWYRCGFT
jgi:hypothetical protein